MLKDTNQSILNSSFHNKNFAFIFFIFFIFAYYFFSMLNYNLRMLNIVLISQIMMRMRSIISRSCLFFSVTVSVRSRFSANNFLYSSEWIGSGLVSASSLNGNKLSMFVCSIPDDYKKETEISMIFVGMTDVSFAYPIGMSRCIYRRLNVNAETIIESFGIAQLPFYR